MSDSPADPSAGSAPPRQHARGDLHTVRTGAMVHGGTCLAGLDDGTALLVDGALPGEVVTVALHHRKGRLWFATTTTVLEPSEHRVDAPCPYYGECGGCQLQHVAAAEQLRLKEAIVRDAMRRQGVALPDAVAVHGMADPWRYRWRGEFHVIRERQSRGEAQLGFNRLRSWRPVAVDDCLIHHPRITGALAGLREVASAEPGLSALHLTAGEDGAELLVRGRPAAALHSATVDAHAAATGTRFSTSLTMLRWRGHAFRVSPETFIQVNWSQLDILYGSALAALGDVAGRRVVDAYAGIGVLACELAAQGAAVTCIESNREAAHLGVLNARLNGCADRVRYRASTVEEAIAPAGVGADAVVLDPPRAGCDARVTAWLALAGPATVVYVSCDPATLARDLRVLAVSGPYRVATLDLVDMFPQTHHVECVVGLRRQPPGGSARRPSRDPGE